MKYTTEFIRNNRNEVDWKYRSILVNISNYRKNLKRNLKINSLAIIKKL